MNYDRNAQREATFQTWWDTYGQPYEAAVIANGGTPWTADLDERREVWMRRYSRPEPPDGLLIDPRRPECYATEGTVETAPAGTDFDRARGAVRHRERLSSLPPIDDTEETAA